MHFLIKIVITMQNTIAITPDFHFLLNTLGDNFELIGRPVSVIKIVSTDSASLMKLDTFSFSIRLISRKLFFS